MSDPGHPHQTDPFIKEGDVWSYPYLWQWQDAQGEESGRKDRPCAVSILMTHPDGVTRVYLLAITSKSPTSERLALSIPEIEKRRANLDWSLDLWIVTDELNVDCVKGSWHLDPSGKIGSFSTPFLKTVKAALRKAIIDGRSSQVRRDHPT